MPLFSWKGIRIDGSRCKGHLVAQSPDELAARLRTQQIAVITCFKPMMWFGRSVKPVHVIALFRELGLLLKSGILLADALQIIEMQLDHPTLQEVVHQLYTDVAKGILLYKAMQVYPTIFDSFMVQMVHVGHENGNLPESLELVSNHLEIVAAFKAKMRSLAIVPVSTLLFFMLISGVMFIVIVPQFVSLFTAAGNTLPRSTRVMILISEWMQSLYMPLIVLIASLAVLVFYRWLALPSARHFKARFYAAVPIVSSLIRYTNMVQFFQSVSLLLDGGMQLVPALHIVQHAIDNVLLADVIAAVAQEVSVGNSFSQALAINDTFFEYHIRMMVYVGEEAAQLSHVLKRISYQYQQKVNRIFDLLSILFQPLLLILLGLLVSWLVLAIYVPLITLSHVVSSQ